MSKMNTREVIGYSFVPNHRETMLALAQAKLSGREFRVVIAILNQTNGYLREEDQISPEYFSKITGIGKDNLPHVLKKLRQRNIIGQDQHRFKVLPPSQWLVKIDEPKGSSKMTKIFVKNDESLVKNDENQIHSKENIYIENIKIPPSGDGKNFVSVRNKIFSSREREKRKIIMTIKERRGFASPRPAAEARAIEWMLKQGYTAEEIVKCYEVMKSEPFWEDRMLFMMSVKSQIGEYKRRGFRPIPPPGARPGYGMPLPSGEELERSWLGD